MGFIRKNNWKGCCILGLAVLFIIYGICRNEAGVVFQKAASICLECIGIG